MHKLTYKCARRSTNGLGLRQLAWIKSQPCLGTELKFLTPNEAARFHYMQAEQQHVHLRIDCFDDTPSSLLCPQNSRTYQHANVRLFRIGPVAT
jgi:hypothetical protein